MRVHVRSAELDRFCKHVAHIFTSGYTQSTPGLTQSLSEARPAVANLLLTSDATDAT